MTAFRLRALLAAGEAPAVLDQVRSIWGPMLDSGPGTFWEEATPDDRLAMYGRPFGRSLCHAWASGPAAILPEAVLGLRPLDDGWARFEVQPALGDLEWASAVVPAPTGDIVVVVDASTVTVHVPADTVLVREGHAVPGPGDRRVGASGSGRGRRGSGGYRSIRGMIHTIHPDVPASVSGLGSWCWAVCAGGRQGGSRWQ